MNTVSRPLQCITLESSSEGPLIVQPDGSHQSQDAYDSILPHLPSSMMAWLGCFGKTVWERHRCCCALLLMLSPDNQSWSVTAPPQSAREDGVSWQNADAVPEDLALPGHVIVGGSFQTTRLTSPDEAESLVALTDGVHLIHPLNGPMNGCWVYLRIAGELDVDFLNGVVFDDFQSKVEAVMQFMGFDE